MRRAIPTEHEEQVTLIEWWAYESRRHGLPEFALFAIPNAGAGAQRGQAGKLKAEGVRKGVADLFLTVPSGEKHGLYIEMKRAKGGSLSDDQLAFLAFADGRNYAVAVCKGFGEARERIIDYLAQRARAMESP